MDLIPEIVSDSWIKFQSRSDVTYQVKELCSEVKLQLYHYHKFRYTRVIDTAVTLFVTVVCFVMKKKR